MNYTPQLTPRRCVELLNRIRERGSIIAQSVDTLGALWCEMSTVDQANKLYVRLNGQTMLQKRYSISVRLTRRDVWRRTLPTGRKVAFVIIARSSK